MKNSIFESLRLPATDGYEECLEIAKTRHGVWGNGVFLDCDASVFGTYASRVASLVPQLSSNPINALYVYFLAELIRRDSSAGIRLFSRPREDEHSELYDSLPLFSIALCIPDMVAELRRRGVPEDVVSSTVGMLENQIGDFVELNGHVGISAYVGWMTGFLTCRMIRVGRFNLEMRKYTEKYDILRHGSALVPVSTGDTFHRSGRILGSAGCECTDGSFTTPYRFTDESFCGCVADGRFCSSEPTEFSVADGWELALTAGDPIVSVHIPTGGPLTPEICDADLARGGDIIRRHFGEFKAYYCSSWLLDPQIKELLGKETNLTAFADRFTRFPIRSNGEAVYEYVWSLQHPLPAEELSEHTSFAKAIKRHLLSGGRIYGAAGVFI